MSQMESRRKIVECIAGQDSCVSQDEDLSGSGIKL